LLLGLHLIGMYWNTPQCSWILQNHGYVLEHIRLINIPLRIQKREEVCEFLSVLWRERKDIRSSNEPVIGWVSWLLRIDRRLFSPVYLFIVDFGINNNYLIVIVLLLQMTKTMWHPS
jgi:hypothetical protein